ncbi:unnamed protein product [Boreogadus saida]
MANFSIEWLSKSFYSTHKETEEVKRTRLPDPPKPGTYSSIEVLSNAPADSYSPTSPNNSCGYTSGSESEQGEDSEGEAGRRMRTKFTSEQINRLEDTFGRHKYLGATQRRKIAEKLSLSETQVKTWFQNRRMKLKRDLQDSRPEFFTAPPGLLPPFLYAPTPAFQHHPLGGQLPLYNSRDGSPQPVRGLSYPAQQLLHQQHMHPLAPPYYY